MTKVSERTTLEKFLHTLDERRSDYEDYLQRLTILVGELLMGAMVDVVSVSGRVKTNQSVREKIKRKRYKNPENELTDICGLRIVVYLESDIEKVVAVIRREFAVDDVNSVDKRKELQPNELGYLSVHLLCSLSNTRIRLAEYSRFRQFRFEAQIRTVLQHAWAQIEWGRNYKFGGVLPVHLQRRLLLASGALEILDREFAAIAADVDDYSCTQKDNPDESINSLVVLSVAEEIASQANLDLRPYSPPSEYPHDARSEVIDELQAFGVKTRSDLQRLFTQELLRAERQVEPEYVNEIGLARNGMMWGDLRRYFDLAHKGHWQSAGSSTIELLLHKYSKEDVRGVLTQAHVSVDERDFDNLDWDEVFDAIAKRIKSVK